MNSTMTAKEREKKAQGELIHNLHEKYYTMGKGKHKARQQKKMIEKLAEEKRKEQIASSEEKKTADVAPVATKTTGVGISSQPKQAQGDDGKLTRKDLMAQAQAKGIKYFRILQREELKEVLKLHVQAEGSPGSPEGNRISEIQQAAQKRWKAGWTSLKTQGGNKREKTSATAGKKTEAAKPEPASNREKVTREKATV